MAADCAEILVRPLEERDLADARRVFSMAFGTFLGLADPMEFAPGVDYISTRWRADATAAFAAEHHGRLVGSSFATNWGSFGFFGPITVLPEYWDQKVAQALLAATITRFEAWDIQHRGLFTFPHSPKHIHLYEKYGFQTGHLTAVMAKPVAQDPDTEVESFSALSQDARETAAAACGVLTGEILAGLNVQREIYAVTDQGIGEVSLIYGDSGLAGFAVCHCGAGTEAGNGTCLVKFGAVRSGPSSSRSFERLLASCEAIAARHRLARLAVGINMGRRCAYRQLRASGFRTLTIGVSMETRPGSSYNRPDVYVIDDWR
jgi:GNAT superfamily N-acetyltransferase